MERRRGRRSEWGADSVLSIQRASARLVAAEVHGERIMNPLSQILLVQADAVPFTGETVAEARRDTERGWIVVGVSRNGTVHTDERTNITADGVSIAGSDEAIQDSSVSGERSPTRDRRLPSSFNIAHGNTCESYG